MRPVVFLGPSLGIQEARNILDATYLLPARQSDVMSCIDLHNPSAIGIVDGHFDQVLSVWHKEILHVLRRGVPVYGSSSMGALRAVEMEAFGMVGVGQVFEMYKSGEVTADDEVALMHGDASSGYRNLSMPLVNIRATLKRALAEGSIDQETHDRVIQAARSLHYPDRVPSLIRQAAQEAGVAHGALERAIECLESRYVNIKQQDALLLLQTLKSLPDPVPRVASVVDPADIPLFEPLYELDRRVRHEGWEVSLQAIANHAALHLADFAELNFAAMNRALVQVLADMLHLEVSDDATDAEEKRFHHRHGVVDADAFDDWLERNDLSAAAFRELMHEVAVCRRLQRWLMTRKNFTRNTRFILDELRLRGRYEEVAREAALEAQVVRNHHPEYAESGHSDVDLAELLTDHLKRTELVLDTHLEEWSREVGFHSVTDLKLALLQARLARDSIDEVARRAFGPSD